MSFLNYFEAKRPKHYVTEWSTRWICLALQRALEERQNLIIEAPPRSGKSELCSVYAPGWWLASHPDATFGMITSEDGLAQKFATATRRLLADQYQFEIDRQQEWKIAGTKHLDLSFFGRGVHSSIQGRAADAVIFDDVIKSGTDANSDAVRERIWTDVVSAAINRLSPQGIVIALQARLHQQDPIGKLLETGMKFMRLRLPAINDAGDGAWFEDGYMGEKTVFPPYKFLTRRYPRARLDEIAATVTSYWWMAQYMQSPSLGDLAFFRVENLPRYDALPNIVRLWTAWDCAQTATKGGSFSAGVALGLTADYQIAVLDVRRGRWTFDQLEREIVDHARTVARLTGLIPENVIIERAASGYGIIDRLCSVLPILPLIPRGSKEDRAAAVCSLVNRGQVLFPNQAPWLSTLLEELASFPLGRTKDQVDALVHALSYCARPSEFQQPQEETLVIYDPLAGPQTEEEIAAELEWQKDIAIGGDKDW